MQPTFFIPRVEDYFSGYNGQEPWQTPGAVADVKYVPERAALSVSFVPDAAGIGRCLLLEVPHPRVFRLRFDPRCQTVQDYPDENSRAIVMDTMAELRATLEPVQVRLEPVRDDSGNVTGHVATVSSDRAAELRLVIKSRPYKLEVYRPEADGGWFLAMADGEPGIRFRPVVEYQLDGVGRKEYQLVRCTRKPATARYLGFGEKAGGSLVKNGKQLTYVNFDNWGLQKWYGAGPLEDREPLYNSNPFFLEYDGADPSPSVYGVLVDNTAPLYMDIAATQADSVQLGTLYDDLDLYHFFGRDTPEVLTLLTAFVGRARLKPRHVLGYHQGCYGYDSRKRLEEISRKYREEYRIPIDGLHIDIDIQQAYRTFTVDERAGHFWEARQMFSGLRARGFKCSTNITPFISDEGTQNTVYEDGRGKGMFIAGRYSSAGINPNVSAAELYRGGIGYGGDRNARGVYPDLGRREARDWWGQQYARLLDLGLEMVWQDMTTPCMAAAEFSDWSSFPLHLVLTSDERKKYEDDDQGGAALTVQTPAVMSRNLYAYNLVKATYHGWNNAPQRDGLRNFIIARGGFTGMHRFAALWTGDNLADWPYLRVNIVQALAGGLSGQPITGADIGGFGPPPDGGTWVDPELLIRWTIAGAFLPWFRNHYIDKEKQPERRRFQEPWAFPENRQRAPEQDRWLYDLTLTVCRCYIELRYRLIQLFYDLMFENTLSGMPIVRPLFVNDDHDAHLFYDKSRFLNTQWFVGRDLLIAPIIEKGTQANDYGTRPVYLPQGSRWYCFMDNRRPLAEPVEGGSQFDFDARLSADPDHLGFLCPMYVRAGAIIPTLELEQYVGERTLDGRPANPVTLNIYPLWPSNPEIVTSYDLYEDDGVSRASAPRPEGTNAERTGTDPKAEGKYRCTRISHQFKGEKSRQIGLVRRHDGYAPALGYLFMAVLHDPRETKGGNHTPVSVLTINGLDVPPLRNETPEITADNLWNSDVTAWYHHPEIQITFIKLFVKGDDMLVITSY